VWQNRSFYIGVGDFGTGTQNQQKVVKLFNAFTTAQAASQANTGACPAAASYWDIGVRGDTAPGTHSSGFTLAPTHSVLTDAGDYPGANNLASNPTVISQYCNGSRVPPEVGGLGWEVPPGTNETNALPTPVFSLTPSATVDEGNNWINLRWGPLALSAPASPNTVLGNYGIGGTSPAIDAADSTFAPSTDYFGHSRPQGNEPDIGAVEFVKAAAADLDLDPSSLAFGNVTINRTSSNQFATLTSAGSANLNVTSIAVTAPFARATGFGLTQNCPTGAFTLTAGNSCRIYVNFRPTSGGAFNGTLTVNASNDASTDYAADHVVALSGTGSRLSVSATTLNFLTVGGGFSNYQTVTVSNAAGNGGGSTGAISAAITGVTNGVTFQLAAPTGGTNCLTHPSLNPGQSCSVRVRFQSPSAFTAGTATLNVSDTEPATVPVTLNGFRF
jgi:hypothetical protein